MALSERLQYILDFNVQGGIRSLEQVGKTAEKELGKAEQKLDKLGANLTKFGVGAMAAAGVAGAALFKMGQGAAETEAAFAALEQVAGATVAQDVAGWAEDGAEKFGMARGQIFEYSASLAGIADAMGLAEGATRTFLNEHLKLAADFAAFKDTTPDQVMQDLQAAYAGSSETLQKYQVFANDANIKQALLNETGKEFTGVLTSQERMLGINLLLKQRHADIEGQWQRESGGLLGQQAQLQANWKNLSDEIGQGVLPMMVSLMETANKVVGVLQSLNDATGGNLGTWAAYGAAVLAATGALSTTIGIVIKARENFVKLGDAARTMSTRFGGLVGGSGVLAMVGLAVATGTAIYQDYRAEKELVIDATNRYKVALEGEEDAQVAVNEAVAEFLGSNERANALVAAGVLTHGELARVIRGEQVPAWDELYGAVHVAGDAYDLNAKAVRDLADATGLSRAEVIQAIKAILAEAEGHRLATEAVERRATAEEELADAVEKGADATNYALAAIGKAGPAENAYIGWLKQRGREAVRANEEHAASQEAAANRIGAAYESTRAAVESGLTAIASGYADVADAAEMTATEIVEAQNEATRAQEAWIAKVNMLKAAYGEDLIGDVLAYAAQQGPEVGQKLIDGLASGELTPQQLESMFSAMDAQSQEVGETAISVAADAAADVAESEFPGVGRLAAEQLALGMLQSTDVIDQAARTLAESALAEMRRTFGLSGGGGGGSAGRASAQ